MNRKSIDRSSKLAQTLGAMSAVERNLFRRFLESPFFNRRDDVVRLCERMFAHGLEPREATYECIYPGAAYHAQRLRLTMSYLQKLAERFLAYRQWEQTPGAPQTDLLRAVRQRGLDPLVADALHEARDALHAQPLRNSEFYLRYGLVLWEEARFESERAPSEVRYLEQLSENADRTWLTQKLRYLCLHRAQQNVYSSDHALRFRAEVEAMASVPDLLAVPAVAIWYHCLNMLDKPGSADHFNRFKSALLAQDQLFDADEIRDLHLLAVNYCIRRANEGHRDFFNDIMDFYKDGLEKGYLLANGVLSRFTYHNIVAAGLQTREFEWVEDFITRYRNHLERTYRDSAYSFNRARLEFSRGRYGAVLALLQNANYYDPLLSLSSKAMSLKIYYETGEFDLLHSHLEAMQNYIRRKTTLGYHRTYYQNLVRFTRRLMALNWRNRRAVDELRAAIEREPALTERAWLLERFGHDRPA